MKTALPLALLALVIIAAAAPVVGRVVPNAPPPSLCGPMAAVCDPYADKCPACKDCTKCHWCSQKGGKCSTCLEAR